MFKIKNQFIRIAIWMYVIMIAVDRFVFKIPNVLYILLSVAGLVLLGIGLVQTFQKKK